MWSSGTFSLLYLFPTDPESHRLIDNLALRVGNEKDTDEEADTVGACSLRKLPYFSRSFFPVIVAQESSTYLWTCPTQQTLDSPWISWEKIPSDIAMKSARPRSKEAGVRKEDGFIFFGPGSRPPT